MHSTSISITHLRRTQYTLEIISGLLLSNYNTLFRTLANQTLSYCQGKTNHVTCCKSCEIGNSTISNEESRKVGCIFVTNWQHELQNTFCIRSKMMFSFCIIWNLWIVCIILRYQYCFFQAINFTAFNFPVFTYLLSNFTPLRKCRHRYDVKRCKFESF